MKKSVFTFLGLICIISSCSRSNKSPGELLYREPGPDKGYNFPYYLFLPSGMDSSATGNLFLIVEPNNSGFVSDDMEKHREKAKRTASLDFYAGNYLSIALKYPLLVPVFPRPESQPTIYTHALDRDVMMQRQTKLERIDLQLLAMIKDARQYLADLNLRVNDKILITGFSASGTFANRFSLLHPSNVAAVAAGGLNGVLMMPFDSLNGNQLIYPVGVGDMKDLSGESFDLGTFRDLPQFLFMGAKDDNDAVPYDDAYNSNERELIYSLLGTRMLPDRWNRCMNIYDSMQIRATFRTYKNMGHEQPEKVKEDILNFFRNNLTEKL